jgi:Aerotolerance regulator N-terminal/von Willebrand factor type A domain
MTFLHPILAAAAIACVSVPIIIHILMRRRRKPVMWAAMRFLLEAYRQHKRRLRLEQLLLLAARCLLVALAGLAIARPLMGSAGILAGRGAVTLYLLIDNGLASTASPAGAADSASALARHKRAALMLLDQLDAGSGDRAALIALGGPARAVVVPPSTGIASVREAVMNLAATDSATDIPGGISTVRSALDPRADAAGSTVIALLSDYLAGSADTQRKLAELTEGPARARLVLLSSRPSEASPPNVTITGVEPLQPILIAPKRDTPTTQQAPVRVALRRSGDGISAAASTTVHFSIQGDQRPTPAGQAVIRWSPGQTETSATARVDMTAAARAGGGSVVLLATVDGDSIAGDNTYRRPIEARQSLRVGLVAPRRTGVSRPGISQYEPADWFRLALQPVDPIAARSEVEIDVAEIEPSALDAGRLSGLDAVVIPRPDALQEGAWKRLRGFADGGGLILVSPPAQATVHLWFDPMVQDLALPWTAGREAKTSPDGVAIALERLSGGLHDMLSMLQGEMQDLAGPVRVRKVLPVEAGSASGEQVLLRLSDGSPLLLASPPGGGREAETNPRGLVVLLTTAMAFEWTDLQSKPLMVALMQELVRQGVGRARGVFAAVAGSSPELPPRSVEVRALSVAGAPGPEGGAIIKTEGGRAAEPHRRCQRGPRRRPDRGPARRGDRGLARGRCAGGRWRGAVARG